MPNNDGKFHIIVEKICNIVIVDIIGRVVKEFKAVPMFDNEITLPEQGVYIVRAGTVVEKVIVK